MVDFKLDDLDLEKTFSLDDLDFTSKKYTTLEKQAGLDLDTRLEDVARDKQKDVARLYDVFKDNPEVVELYKQKINNKEIPVINDDFLTSIYGPNWNKIKELKNDIKNFKKLAGSNVRGYFGKNIGSYPPTDLKRKFYLDDKYDVYNRGLALSETESIPFIEEKIRAGAAGLEKGVKGIGLTITEVADVAAGTEFTDWLDDNWDTVDTGGGLNKVLDVFGQFGLGYGAGLKVINSIRKLKQMKRGKPLQKLGFSEKTSKIAGRMGYYSLPALIGDAAVMNPEDKQFGEIFNAYSFGNPDLENLTNREKAIERLKRRTIFGLEGAGIGAGVSTLAKPLLKGTGKVLTTKIKDIPGIGETLKKATGESVYDSSIANIPLRTIGSAMNIGAAVTAPVLGIGAKALLKTINKSGLPPYEQWRYFSTTADPLKKRILKRVDNVLAYIRTSKDLPREIFDLVQRAGFETNAISNVLKRSFDDIDKEIRGALEKSFEEYGTRSPQQFEHIVDDIVEYLKGAIGGKGAKGKFLNELPKNLRQPVSKVYSGLRKLRDETKLILKDDQYLYDDILSKIKEHFNISYRAFRNPRFKPDPKVKNQAIDEIEKIIKKNRFYNVEAQLNPRGSAIALVDEILKLVGTSKDNSFELLEAVANLLPKNFPVAAPGEKLPDVIKKLLGGKKRRKNNAH